MHVTLGDQLVATLQINLLKPSRQVNASALAHVHRLDNKSLGLFLVKLCLKIVLI